MATYVLVVEPGPRSEERPRVRRPKRAKRHAQTLLRASCVRTVPNALTR